MRAYSEVMEPEASVVLADQLVFSYPPLDSKSPETPLLHDVTFSLDAGQALMVLGASGSGKSTLCYLLSGLAPRHTGGQFSGSVRILGQDVMADPPLPSVIQVLFQDAATQLFNTSAENEVAWGLEALGVSDLEIGPRVMAALRLFGLLDHRHQPPWKLSGGQQKRLALAALWALHPSVLLLDEPLGGVDPGGRAEVLDALHLLRGEGTTLLFTSPHLDARWNDAALAETVALLDKGVLSASESTACLLAEDQKLTAAGLRCPESLWHDLAHSRRTVGSGNAIEVCGVRYRYADGPPVLHGIDLAIPQGQFVAFVGANGAGKTTLIRHLNGLLRPDIGEVWVMGKRSVERSVGQLSRDVGFLFQRPEQQIFGATVWEEVAYGPRHLHLPDVEERVECALRRFDLTSLAHFPPAVLSYGAQRSVTLASLAALDTPVLVLDEPTVGLDGRGRAQLLAWLAELRASGVTIVLVTHEMALAQCADRVLAMEQGRIVDDYVPEGLA